MLETRRSIVIGNQTIRSQALGVSALATTPSTQYATTTHTSFLETGCQAGMTSPARTKTTIPSARRRNAEATDATRIWAGSAPGKLPPHASSPHGIPAANVTWKRLTPAVSAANRRAARNELNWVPRILGLLCERITNNVWKSHRNGQLPFETIRLSLVNLPSCLLLFST